MQHKVIFKKSTAGLTLEFFIYFNECLTNAKEPHLPYYYWRVTEERTDGFMLFPRELNVKHKQLRPRFEHESPMPFPSMITIIVSMPYK